eukprot:jgi/Mesvir1/12536/Mv21633-RA.1
MPSPKPGRSKTRSFSCSFAQVLLAILVGMVIMAVLSGGRLLGHHHADFAPTLPLLPRTCPQGCSDHGTCNLETGECVCPMWRKGPACSEPALPSCTVDSGYIIPCQAHVPKPCRCAMECAVALGGADPDKSVACYDYDIPAHSGPSKEPSMAEIDAALARMLQSPLVLREAADDRQCTITPSPSDGTPGKRHVISPNGSCVALSPVYAGYLHPAGSPVGLSMCGDHRCSLHGHCAIPHSGSKPAACTCYFGHAGAACEREAVWCFGGCGGPTHGTCLAGFCHCKPGYWGQDCSLTVGPHGAPALWWDVEGGNGMTDPARGVQTSGGNGQRDGSYAPGGNRGGDAASHGHPYLSSQQASPSPRGDANSANKSPWDERWAHPSPRIYVYELPPRFHAHQAVSQGQPPRDLNREMGVMLVERIMSSAHRVADASAADYFLVPAVGNQDECSRLEALEYVRARFPFWDAIMGNSHGGKDTLPISTNTRKDNGDQGGGMVTGARMARGVRLGVLGLVARHPQGMVMGPRAGSALAYVTATWSFWGMTTVRPSTSMARCRAGCARGLPSSSTWAPPRSISRATQAHGLVPAPPSSWALPSCMVPTFCCRRYRQTTQAWRCTPLSSWVVVGQMMPLQGMGARAARGGAVAAGRAVGGGAQGIARSRCISPARSRSRNAMRT